MRKIWDIPGGIHPPENKRRSLKEPYKDLGLPSEIILPLNQHIGVSSKPIVDVGDYVLTGQLIAEAGGFVSVPMHASTSGKVVAIEDRPIIHPSGMAAPCVVIEPDGGDKWVDLEPCDDYMKLDREVLLEKIRNAGISGMGGAGFPASVKLKTRDDRVVNTLIINAAECEPYITADDILMQTVASNVIDGTRILSYLLGDPDEVLIGIEDNKLDAITALKDAAKGTNVEVVVIPTKYPSGGEKQLIQILTGKEVPGGGLPVDLGIVCQNVGSTSAIYRAVHWGKPLVSRITTVVGGSLSLERNVSIRFGTPISHVLKEHAWQADKCKRVIAGGPMMGVTVSNLQSPIVKTTNCLLVPNFEELLEPPPAQACIRCGMCAEVCPVNLMPQQLYMYGQAQDYDRLKTHSLPDCIECGACSYVCPSNIQLVQSFRASKGAIRRITAEKIKSDHSRLRFDTRNERIAQEDAEKEAKRLARKVEAGRKKKEKAVVGSKDVAERASVELVEPEIGELGVSS